jgi:ATP-dependent helicase/nuclease subunit B
LPIELLLAPPAAGKTEICIKRINHIHVNQPLAKIWVIVPDRLQAAAFRKRLANTGGSLGVQVGRFDDLFKSILEQNGTYIPSATPTLLHRLIQDTIDTTIEKGDLPYFAPLRLFPGFILALRDSFAELKRSLISPERFTEFAQKGTPSQKDLAVLYTRYQAHLRELNLADKEDLNWIAISALENQSTIVSSIQLLIIDGFDSFNGAQYKIMKLLSEQVGDLLVTFPGGRDLKRQAHHRFIENIERLIFDLSPNITSLENQPYLPSDIAQLEKQLFEVNTTSIRSSGNCVLLEARTTADEVRETLRWIKKLVVRNQIPLSSCMIFTPNPVTYHPLLRLSAMEFGIPIRFTLDEALDASPALTALANLLSLAIENFNSHYLINTLHSPYFDFSITMETIDTFEIISRVAQIVEGQSQWDEVWARLEVSTDEKHYDLDDERNSPKLPRGTDANALRQIMDSVFQTILPPGEAHNQTEWITWLEDLLERLRFYERADSETDRAACDVFRETLRALVLSEVVAGERKVDYRQFVSDLLSTVRSEGFREPAVAGQPALLVGRMTEARGTRYQAVALMGLSEGSFPTNERPDPFLDEDLRQALGLESRLQREQAGLFYQAITRADQFLLLTRPYLSEDGEQWEASTFWKSTKNLLEENSVVTVNPDTQQSLSEAASTQELLFSAVQQKKLPREYQFLITRWQDLQHAWQVLQARRSKRIDGPHEGSVEPVAAAVNQQFSLSETWSASRLQSYGICPFQFFVANLLDLDRHELPKLGLDARQLGLMLHEILELTYKGATDVNDLPSLLASLHAVSRQVFAKAPDKHGFRPSPLWEIEQAQLLEKLEETIKVLASDTTWTPIAFERKFGIEQTPVLEIKLESGVVRIRGVIDRVDRNADGELRVVDYKSGSSHLTRRDLERGYSLQLPLYALAARDALGLGEPIEGIYWKILAAEPGSLKLGKFSTDIGKGVDAAVGVLREQLTRIMMGIREAKFPPDKPEDGCPSYCPAAQWCWRYEPGFSAL